MKEYSLKKAPMKVTCYKYFQQLS